jgi:hypothetical protein
MSNPRVPKTERCEIDNHHLQSNTPKFEEVVVVGYKKITIGSDDLKRNLENSRS